MKNQGPSGLWKMDERAARKRAINGENLSATISSFADIFEPNKTSEPLS